MITLKGEHGRQVSGGSVSLYYNSIYEMFRYEPAIESFWDPPDFNSAIEKFVDVAIVSALTCCTRWAAFGISALSGRFSITVSSSPAEDWDWRSPTNGRLTNCTGPSPFAPPAAICGILENYKRSSTYLVVSAPARTFIKTKHDFELIRKYAPPEMTWIAA